MTARYHRTGTRLALGLALSCATSTLASDITEAWRQGFIDSRIEVGREGSHVPMFPLAYLSYRHDQEATLETRQGPSIDVQQRTLSQAALVPFPVTRDDVLIIGDWLGWTRFDTTDDQVDTFDVVSVGLPIGWLHQFNPQWQAAGFVMPLGHHASLADSDWSLETMGGAFGRYIQSDNLWWAFGLYADINRQEQLYLPYLGASWAINEHWTVNALMPWPNLVYSPGPKTLFSVGASPNGSSWVLDSNDGEVNQDLSGWDLGIAAERRLVGDLWLKAEAGYGGLRGLSRRDGDWERPELDLDGSSYLRFGINYRPSLAP